jgi:hypothetical protein
MIKSLQRNNKNLQKYVAAQDVNNKTVVLQVVVCQVKPHGE